MSPQEAARWWRDQGGHWQSGWKLATPYPRYNTPQELYRIGRKRAIDEVGTAYGCRGANLYKFERGELKEISDIAWIRLASFYGIHVLSVGVNKKTEWWEKYRKLYARISGKEGDHLRIRNAATRVLKAYNARRAKIREGNAHKCPTRPVEWYRQGSLLAGGVY
jgi:hypothetical protein